MARTKEVAVEMPDLDGGRIHLRMDFNAVARVEEETGLNLMAGDMDSSMSGTQLRAFVHACAAAYDEARGKDPQFTTAQIGMAMGLEEAGACVRAIRDLLGHNVATPPADAEEAGEDGTEVDPTSAADDSG